MPRLMRMVLFLAGCGVVAATPPASACAFPQPRPFDEVLHAAKSAAVIRLEEVRLKPKGLPGKIKFSPTLEADVYVAETLFGEPARIERLDFRSSWCGGHHLDAGEYYVILIEENEPVVTLAPGAQSIVPTYYAYDPRKGSAASPFRLFMHLRNFANIGVFPAAFPIQKYLDGARPRPRGGRTRELEYPPLY